MAAKSRGQCVQLFKLVNSHLYNNGNRKNSVHCTRYSSLMCREHMNKLHLVNSRPYASATSDSDMKDGVHSRRPETDDRDEKAITIRKLPQSGPQLSDFIQKSVSRENESVIRSTSKAEARDGDGVGSVPYINPEMLQGNQRKVYFQTYGCQMNVSDTEIAWSILKRSGYTRTDVVTEADVILLMTCAIREGAEDKVWNRLQYFKSLKKKQRGQRAAPVTIGILVALLSRRSSKSVPHTITPGLVLLQSQCRQSTGNYQCRATMRPPTRGDPALLLGCMAERLKQQIVEREKLVNVVCGPDAYRDLPHLLASSFASGQAAVNVQLSLEETYADVIPVRHNPNSHSAFVSIMRGCDNMCTYCIVPFTRGRERSRPITSIVEDIQQLSNQGVREVTLLGQNVNSYRDMSESSTSMGGVDIQSLTEMSRGFRTVYKPRSGGRRFADLLEKVSLIDPEMRIRFTSPHPKDFPDEVLKLIQEKPNICRQLHLPAQSGSDAMMEAMGRGYTRAAYLDLVHHIRTIIPDVALSSDFIAGFCGETEADHQDTLSLIRDVQYNFAFCFSYSMRQKTRAFHRLKDDVPAEVKQRRHTELVAAFRAEVEKIHASQIGSKQLVLVEGTSKRSSKDWVGRNEANTRVIFPKSELPSHRHTLDLTPVESGDYVAVQVISGTSQILRAVPLYHTTLQDFWKHKLSSQFSSRTTQSLEVQV